RVQQAQEVGSLRELRSGNPVIEKDVAIVDRPAFPGSVGFRGLDLSRDGLLVLSDSALVGRFPRVDCCLHGALGGEALLSQRPEILGQPWPWRGDRARARG